MKKLNSPVLLKSYRGCDIVLRDMQIEAHRSGCRCFDDTYNSVSEVVARIDKIFKKKSRNKKTVNSPILDCYYTEYYTDFGIPQLTDCNPDPDICSYDKNTQFFKKCSEVEEAKDAIFEITENIRQFDDLIELDLPILFGAKTIELIKLEHLSEVVSKITSYDYYDISSNAGYIVVYDGATESIKKTVDGINFFDIESDTPDIIQLITANNPNLTPMYFVIYVDSLDVSDDEEEIILNGHSYSSYIVEKSEYNNVVKYLSRQQQAISSLHKSIGDILQSIQEFRVII